MERMTHKNKGMTWYKSDLLLLEPCEMSYSQVREVLQRLAAYEDTGLTPEEIRQRLNANTCVSCGEIIPEGRQVCLSCMKKAGAIE